jgi:hypothetical protein
VNYLYEEHAKQEMRRWQKDMQRKPGITGKISRAVQQRINRVIPEKVHKAITTAFKTVVTAMLKGAEFISGSPALPGDNLELTEARVDERIKVYKTTSAAEGAITGAGGILLGLADFPLWLTLKMKLLSDIALLYGHDTGDYKERLYLLYVFQLAFSSREHRRKIYAIVANWDNYSRNLPDASSLDWRTFQQEYRDYIDLAKLFQLVPGIGAFVGFYVNHKLTDHLGQTAMNAYRMRRFGSV